MQPKRQERKVIHLQLNNNHSYYGSIASLFNCYSQTDLGYSYFQVKNNLGKLGIMQNDKCTIRQGIIKAKISNRGNKNKHNNK